MTLRLSREDMANPNPNAWAEFTAREARKAFWIIVKQGWL